MQFQDWVARYLATPMSERSGLLKEGIHLAGIRRDALKALIQTDPERALELAVPHSVRRALPAEIAGLLEDRVSGRGRLAVLAALAEPGKESEVTPTFRRAELTDREYDAFVYGRRLGEPTRTDIPLNGIAVDGFLAVNENPLRILEADEAEAALAENADPLCSVSSLPAKANDRPVVADAGGQTLFFCQPVHVIQENDRLVAAEGSGPTGEAGDPEASAWTEGQKKLILIRVDFPDLVGVNLTDSGCVNLINSLNAFYSEMSYGRAGFASNTLGSDFTPVFRMPQPAAYYGTNNYYNQLRTDARNAATAAGYTLSSYNLDVICFGSVPGWGWAGLGYVGAAGSWLRNSFGTGVAGHELGHNYGLNHAAFWDTSGQSVIGSGTLVEYGDSFDTMGAANAGNNHFNARYKNYLNWLTTNEVITATSNGTYRIFAHDNANGAGIRGLRIMKNSQTNYWVEFRQKFTSNKWLMSGGGLRRAGNGNQKSQLLDTTPGTLDGRTDSAIVIGRTFSDRISNLHITPVGKGGTSPESLDVVVNLGSFPGNEPPVVGLTASSTNAGTGVTLTFDAIASDPNGDALAYYWSFGDGNFGTNGPGAARSWTSAGEYVVRCEVTDMKGGVGSKSVIVRIGSPTTFRIGGQVQSTNGPLQGVRVYVNTTRMAWTDSDGTYTITGLPAGSYTVAAVLENYSFSPAGFANPVVVGPNAQGVDFLATSSTLTAPIITTQPASQTVNVGANVTFSVVASGSTPLAYQWRFNGANIAGATGSSYTKSNVQATNAGNYSVVVSNVAGTATSANAVLTVNTPPVITSQPQGQTVIAGSTATFSVSATGSGLSYQWRHLGTNLPGATASTYARVNAQPIHNGNYSVVITNSLGAVTSAPAALTVNYLLTTTATTGGTVSRSPDLTGYTPGAVVTITANSVSSFPFGGWSGDASGTANPLVLTMSSNLNITANFVSPVPDLIVDNPQATFTGSWATDPAPADKYGVDCRTSASIGGSATGTATFTPTISVAGTYDVYVWTPTITRGAMATPVFIAGDGTSLSLTVNQSTNSSGWQLLASGLPFAAGTSGYVQLANNAGQGGNRSVVADAVRWAYSPNQVLTPPVITTQPTNVTTVAGSQALLSAAAAGSAPLCYQWLFGGNPLAGATNDALLLDAVQVSQAGNYCLIATNPAGAVTSAVATLSVLLPPQILQSPLSQRVVEGGSVTFSALAIGDSPLTYQWRFNEQPLTNVLSPSLTWSNALPSQAGTYDVLVSNPAGSATSSPASLIISVRPWLISMNSNSNGAPQFSLLGTFGDRYAVESSTNLSFWSWLGTVTNTDGQVQFADPTGGTAPQRFYRARLLP